MPLSAGTRLGPYEIVAPLGAGGMGEVYRATDTRLKRQVAIKILPGDLASDMNRLARFQREAELLASLNHSHIAAIYGFEESGAVRALVMELIEGPTLADRIAQGPIPIDEALQIARQIAEALEAAHEQGIVHRDLKPANIKVRDDGAVKVLDFGLAKARDAAGSSSDIGMTINALSSPTMASPAMSQAGAILGTAAYMSPEQARGKAVDKRTDVWAFGAVLYEMLTGRRAFEGDDVAELIASVMKSTPDWSALPAGTPPQVVTLIQRCLDKDKKTRIGDIAVARFLLSGDAAIAPSAAGAASVVASAPRSRLLVPSVAAALVAGALIGWLLPRRSGVAQPPTRLLMDVRPAEQLTPAENSRVRPSRTAITISPDGRRVVFAGVRGGAAMLYARELDRPDAVPLAGTEGAQAPFFSPDGAWIGFSADNRLKKVPAAGGPAAGICQLPEGPFWGASWGEDGNVYLASPAGIARVPAAGGTPAPITTLDPTKGNRHLLPQLLPGGKAIIFTSPPDVDIRSLATGEQHTLIKGGSDARYVRTGHLIYMGAGTLMAVPFDVRSAQLTGPPVALVDGVMMGMNAGNSNNETLAGQFAISDSGTLLYATGGVYPMMQSTLVLADRNGAVQTLPGSTPQMYLSPRLSPDGQKVLVEAKTDANQGTDLWVYDVARGSPTRLTFDGSSRPVWSPDGKRVVYAHGGGAIANLYLMNADGTGKPERLATSEFTQSAASWSAGTNTIVFMQRPTPQTFGIWALPMDGPDATKPRLILESRFLLVYPELSPDGRWIAYVSLESGTRELYLQAYPAGGEKTRVSTAGAWEPIWTRNGRELLYRTYTATGERHTMSAAIRSLSPLRIDPPREIPVPKGEYDGTTPTRAWDATADGQRFLMARVIESTDKPVTTLQIVLNWTDELQRRVRN